jgi:hypothetical protein
MEGTKLRKLPEIATFKLPHLYISHKNLVPGITDIGFFLTAEKKLLNANVLNVCKTITDPYVTGSTWTWLPLC